MLFTCVFRACPYVLDGHRCGHSFCALCLLKWAFTNLHSSCGTWHTSLECPLCRAELAVTPPDAPRPRSTCVFVPNRIADELLTSMVQQLADVLEPPENSESSHAKGKGKASRKGTALDPILLDDEEEVFGWRKKGPLRKEWDQRDKCVTCFFCFFCLKLTSCICPSRLGRDMMNELTRDWAILQPIDFVEFKERLGL